jgi:hypothetical protein
VELRCSGAVKSACTVELEMESSHPDLSPMPIDFHDKLLKLRDKLLSLNLIDDALLVERAARELRLVTTERDKLKHDWMERQNAR